MTQDYKGLGTEWEFGTERRYWLNSGCLPGRGFSVGLERGLQQSLVWLEDEFWKGWESHFPTVVKRLTKMVFHKLMLKYLRWQQVKDLNINFPHDYIHSSSNPGDVRSWKDGPVLGASTEPREDPHLVPSAHIRWFTLPVPPVLGDLTPACGRLWAAAYVQCTQTHAHIYIIKNSKLSKGSGRMQSSGWIYI